MRHAMNGGWMRRVGRPLGPSRAGRRGESEWADHAGGENAPDALSLSLHDGREESRE